MDTYLFIHGAFHGGWCWSKIKTILEKEENIVLAPDLPGCGKDTTDRTNVTLQTYTDFIMSLIEKSNLTNLIIVAHSMGAATAAIITEKFPARIKKVVFIAGTLIDNECIFDVIPPERKEQYLKLAKERKDNSVPVSQAIVREHFLNGCDEKTIEYALKNLTPQAIGTYTTKISLAEFKTLNIPSAYIVCTKDLVVPKEKTQTYLERLTKNNKILQIESSHEPMLEKPKELVKLLKTI